MIVRVKDTDVVSGLLECLANHCAEKGYNSISVPSEYEGKVVKGDAVLMGIDLRPGITKDNSIFITGCDTKSFMKKYQAALAKRGYYDDSNRRSDHREY